MANLFTSELKARTSRISAIDNYFDSHPKTTWERQKLKREQGTSDDENNLPFKFLVKGQQLARQRSRPWGAVKKILNYSLALFDCCTNHTQYSDDAQVANIPVTFFSFSFFLSIFFSVFVRKQFKWFLSFLLWIIAMLHNA